MMSELSNFPTEALEKEIAKRKQREESKPKILANRLISASLIFHCKKYLDDIAMFGTMNSDTRQYIFEEAMKNCFGSNVFEWISRNVK